ncbi:MAG: hypothetical protein HEQ24_17285 [Dolichospermum sp. BR01]|nr:hypothetical protein [Dolichospermum sp. BR01]
MLTLFEEAQNIDLELAEFRKKRLISDYRIFINLNVEIEVYLITEHSDGLQSYFDGKEEKYWINFKPFTQDEIRNYPALENIFVDDQDSKIHLGLKYRFHSLLDSVEKISNNDNGSVCPVVNFYSYKGGMGRTTTLTSYAIHLALAKGKKVVIIDCDLEAPGYLNFFNLSENRSLLAGDKNGIVEYLLDEQFIKEEKPNLEDYYLHWNDPKTGEGDIFVFPAGNLSDEFTDESNTYTHREHYLQGLARLDTASREKIIEGFKHLFQEINKGLFRPSLDEESEPEKVKPDIILIDSRTGFNDIFGFTALALSDLIVGFFGSSEQTKPGLLFLLETFYKNKIANDKNNELLLINSILPANLKEEYFAKFNSNIHEIKIVQDQRDNYMPTVLPLSRVDNLEGIGLFKNSAEETDHNQKEREWINFILGKSYEDYQTIFKMIDEISFPLVQEIDSTEIQLRNDILRDLQNILPDLYAEDVVLEPSKFFYRDCMKDLFNTDMFIVQGFKGTGKTFLYKALKEQKEIQNELKKLAEIKEDFEFNFIDIISEKGNKKNNNKDKLFDFKSLKLSTIEDKDYYFKYFWLVYTWNSVMLDAADKLGYNSQLKEIVQPIKPDLDTTKRFKEIIKNESKLIDIEKDLTNLDQFLKNKKVKLIVLYDQLDNLVRPDNWSFVISPLIDYWWNSPFKNIFSKIFVRTDLFDRMRLTNTERLKSKTIQIEWSRNEIYSYFFKLVFSNEKCKQNIFELMRRSGKCEDTFIHKVKSDLDKNKNQLMFERNIIEPFMTVFFGEEVRAKWSLGKPYDWFYKNLSNADEKSISLRPFINLIKESVKFASQNETSYPPILHYAYYCNSQNRAKAVEAHFNDLTRGEFNQDLRIIFDDLREFGDKYKQIFLTKEELNSFLDGVYTRNQSDLESKSSGDLRRLLEANGIIHENPMPDGSIYKFAQLYQYWLGLRSRKYELRSNRQRSTNKPSTNNWEKPKPKKHQ